MSIAKSLQYNTTITVFRVTQDDATTDIFGNPTYDEDAGTEYPAKVRPWKFREEELDPSLVRHRETRISVYEVTTIPTADILATDEIEWEGTRYTVHGRPQLFYGRLGPHRLKVIIRLEEG